MISDLFSSIYSDVTVPRPDLSLESILGPIYMIAGALAVVAIIFAAIKITASAGRSERIIAGKNAATYSILGLVIVVGASSIVGFVLSINSDDRQLASNDTLIVQPEDEALAMRSATRALNPASSLPTISKVREEIQEEVDPARTVFYMSPDGSDANDGTENSPFLTLQHINQVLKNDPPDDDVRIIIAPGRYYNQRVEWDYFDSERRHYVRFEAQDISNRPVFDGCTQGGSCNGGGTFFSARPGDGIRTNLDFWYLRVENYQVAIQLGGRRGPYNYRENEPHWDYSSGNRIYGMWFENIGEDDTAVVRLVNGRDNLIQNNHFINAISEVNPRRLHAVYMAHHSSNNAIRNNRFVNISGDAVRVRDESNFNSITGNTFESAGVYGYSDWFCNGKTNDRCTKNPPEECPSWGNEFRNNILGSQYKSNRSMRMFVYYQEEEIGINTGDFVPNYPGSDACARPDATTPKLRTSGNTRL